MDIRAVSRSVLAHEFLEFVTVRHLDLAATAWLDGTLRLLAREDSPTILAQAFDTAARRIPVCNLELSSTELADAQRRRPGWQPQHWNTLQAARTLLVLALRHQPPEMYVPLLDGLFTTASEPGLVALYQSLPVLPYPAAWERRAAEGVRSNMTSVVRAVALANPYPAEALSEGAFNQMVLKAVFLDLPLAEISGLARRANSTLADMLLDFARERFAARRRIHPELPEVAGPFLSEEQKRQLDRMMKG